MTLLKPFRFIEATGLVGPYQACDDAYQWPRTSPMRRRTAPGEWDSGICRPFQAQRGPSSAYDSGHKACRESARLSALRTMPVRTRRLLPPKGTRAIVAHLPTSGRRFDRRHDYGPSLIAIGRQLGNDRFDLGRQGIVRQWPPTDPRLRPLI